MSEQEPLIGILRQALAELAAPGDPRYSEPESWQALEDLRSLLIECDSAISHMHYRGTWPLDRFETDRLIGRLRREA
jgi:hypothetical protein